MPMLTVSIALLSLGNPFPRLAPGNHDKTIEVNGQARTYFIHVPKSYDPEKATPVVLALHPFATTATMFERLSGLSRASEREGFVVVYPNGTGRGNVLAWNDGMMPLKKVDDVGFLSKVLDEVETQIHVDKRRVYATGMSNGAMMCYRLASELSGRIAAVAAVAGTMTVRRIESKRPVPILHIHGTSDTIVPYAGGKPPGPMPVRFRSVEESVLAWAKFNGCPETPRVEKLPDAVTDGTQVLRRVYGPGKGGAEVVLYIVEGGGHTWPGRPIPVPLMGKATRDVSGDVLICDFFRKHSLN